MKVNPKVFKANVQKFVTERIAPSLDSDLQRFVLGFALGGDKAYERLTSNPMAKMLGLIDEKGDVDVDELDKCFRGGFNTQNVLPLDNFGIPFKGLTQDDADAFFGQFRANVGGTTNDGRGNDNVRPSNEGGAH